MKKISYFADFGQVKHKTPLRETGYLSIYFFYFFIFYFLFIFYLPLFFECLGVHLFSSPTCDLRDTMPRQRSLTLLPKEAQDFPRGGNYSKHVPLLTYLAWLQSICHNSRFVFIHINTGKAFTCGENFDKEIFFFSGSVLDRIRLLSRSATTLISNHKL